MIVGIAATSPAGEPVAPLQGLRVLAVEQMIAAPWATQVLGRLGADVIKIEQLGRGDSGRGSVPTVVGADDRPVGATFLRNNLNKRSVAVDLDRGAELVLSLAECCDVFVQNYKAGALEQLGLGYDAVAARNPGIVYVSVTGFGTTTPSPYQSWPAYASVAEAMSGIYEWTRQPGQRPVINPVGALGDIGSAMFACVGILAALRQRDRTGLGQHVDVAMYDCMVALTDVVPSLWSLGVRDRIPGAILTTFDAADGAFVAQVSREHQFVRLAEFVGHPEWCDDQRFATRQGWIDHLEDVIRPAVEAWAGGLGKLEAAGLLAAAGIPAGPCFTPPEVLSDPHLAGRHMLVTFEHEGGTYVVPGLPLQFSEGPIAGDRRSPTLGEHTDQVLDEVLGLGPAEVARLRADGMIA
jgi:crotonobetainyl-CoA:carnitine CoA-transferase CaiB-like acyl-CoA transferase